MSGESRSVAFIVGLALYWQAIINQIFPPSLFGTIAGGFGPHAGYTTGVCLMIAALGVVFFAGRKHLVRFCQNLSLTLVCLLVLFSLSVVVFAFLDEGTMGYVFACSINAFLYSLLIFVLTFLWARRFESFSGSGPLFEVALSFACSVLIAFVGSQVASLLSVHEGQLQIIYPPLSGALLLTTTGVRRIAWVDYREGLACVTDRIGKSPQFMACGILGMYLLFSSAYWSVNTEGMGESVSSIMREPSHKLLLLLMALVFSAAVLKRPSILTKHSYFVPCFVALCIGVLYVVALFWDSLVGVCNAVVLPTRAFSMLLLWLLLMVMAKDYSISFSMLAASFFLPVISITWLVAYVFWNVGGD